MNQRKPRQLPTIEPATTANSELNGIYGTNRLLASLSLPAISANTINAKPTIPIIPLARPSIPSVRFTAFEDPAITNTVSTTKAHDPRIIRFGDGIYMLLA